ncbi:Anaphase-promoting complex subunit 2 [Penicillium rolfsii]|nr:Anaphase-promoting complex subunit 2 [Penicillium rolfsii]
MISSVPLNASRRRVFGSVFSPASLQARPTSASGPDRDQTQLASFQSTASSSTVKTAYFASSQQDRFAEAPHNRETWEQAWSAATTFLAIPDQGFTPIHDARESGGSEELKDWGRLSPPSKEAAEALSYLTAVAQPDDTAHGATGLKSLVDWYGDEIRRHFLANLRSGLYELLKTPEREGLIRTIVHYLQLARRIYLAPIVHYLLPILQTPERGRVLTQLQRGFHTVVSYSLPWSKISPLLGGELAQDALIILGIDTLLEDAEGNGGEGSQDEMEVDRQYSVSYEHWKDESSETRARMMTEGEDDRVTMARDRLLAFLNGLQQVGLGGDKAQKVFASVMNIMMTEFVRAAYTGQWEAPTSVPQHLRHWIENVFARLAVQVLAIIHTPQTANQSSSPLDVSFGDVEKWQEMGIARLGALRTSELFDVIVEWPASSGAVEDLRHFTTHPAARAHVTQSFITSLTQRLLHPGASTVEILQVYISIIRAFHLLDPKGVLLDRIARPIRRYLRERDDTIKVIVSGLLAEPAAGSKHTSYANETLVELSTELSKAHQLSMENNTSELDWDDMNWMPDPVDAAPDYRKSKSSDVIDSVISLFDSKEAFVKELQTLLSDRLLQKRENYDQEISVLELLKVRFGDSALQACEVMLRDISDSQRVNKAIREDQGLVIPTARLFNKNKRPPSPPVPDLHAKILSRFFWPEIQDQEFKIPEEVVSLQRRYAIGFEALKASRKLTWRNGLGQVLVELQLADRDFSEEVTTWQATVIHAFHSDYDEPTSRTISDLSNQLEMSPSLVRSACLFWVSKRILTESSRDEFSVLESLPSDDEDNDFGVVGTDPTDADLQSGDASNAAAAAEAAAAAAAKESADAAAMEKMNLYWQFIVGMLTNQGAMPLQRIVMMLKIVVPGGFPFSNEELRDFLAGMVAKGKLEIVSGGNYKIVP